MATNYNKWDQWDAEKAAVACEQNWEVDGLEEQEAKDAAKLRDATSAVYESTMRSAEALKAKVCELLILLILHEADYVLNAIDI